MTQIAAKWNEAGRYLSQVQLVHTLMRQVFEGHEVGPEILPWMISEGQRDFFLKMDELAEKFLAVQRVRVINRNTILVNLSAESVLPFEGCSVARARGNGWVKLERRRGNLYLDGAKVTLFLHPDQKNPGKPMPGSALEDHLKNAQVLHPNIVEALIAHNHMVPRAWKTRDDEPAMFIHFWAVIFQDENGYSLVRCISWKGNKAYHSYGRLSGGWHNQSPAAIRYPHLLG